MPLDPLKPDLSGYCFVGISTAQNTANLVPAAQFRATTYVAIDTEFAHQRRWSAGMARVLTARGVRCQAPLRPDPSRGPMLGVYEAAADATEGVRAVAWLLGGGQKAHQLGLWDIFRERIRAGHPDVALYADPGRCKTAMWFWDGEEVAEAEFDTHTDLTLDEVLACFERQRGGGVALAITEDARAEVRRFRANRVYRRSWMKRSGAPAQPAMDLAAFLESADEPTIKRHLSQVFRARLDRSRHERLDHKESRENLARGLAKALLAPKVWGAGPSWTAIETPFGTLYKYSDYFEHIVQTIVADRLPCWGNVTIHRAEQTNSEAEHDALVMTPQATLVSLDAKTFSVSPKDLDSRLLRLSRASGLLSRFVLVFPYFLEDLDLMPKQLQELPFQLAKLRQPFAVVSSDTESFRLARDADGAPTTISDGGVLCHSLETYLNTL